LKAESYSFDIRRAAFPAVLTGVSFIAFLVVYWILIRGFVESYYWEGLLLAIPFVVYGIITYMTAKGKVSKSKSKILTIGLATAFGILTAFFLIFIVLNSIVTTTTDVSRYKVALDQMGSLTQGFPREIPDNAEEVSFSYHPALGQGGEELVLRFKTDKESIRSYKNMYTRLAAWHGFSTDWERTEHGVFDGTLYVFGGDYNELPSDLEIYVLYSRPYQPGKWNHGERSMVLISEENLKIVFNAEDW